MVRFLVLCFCCIFFLSLIRSPVTEHPNSSEEALRLLPPAGLLYDSLRTDFSDYMWPTDAGRLVTSVFAEYRSTHFHGGIDVSTGDDTGFRVFASRDGYVERILVSPTGYGKMLWVRHADGFSTTYAHLRNFNEAIDAFVEREQLRLERYPVDIDCGPQQFPVKKGELIAYTGETGTGSPHLHFEIRDQNRNFVNPLLSPHFTFPDNLLPSFYLLAVTPLGEESVVNGSFDSHVIRFKNPLQGTTVVRDTIYVYGSFGFAVDVRDRIDNSRFRNGVYSIRVFLNDSLIYSVQLDRAPSSGDLQSGLYFDYALVAEEGGKIAKLYMHSPNRLPFHHPQTDNAGIINTALFHSGPHRYRIVTSDFWKNSSEISGTIVFSNPGKLSIAESSGLLQFNSGGAELNRLRLFSSIISKQGRIRWKEEFLRQEGAAVRLSGIKGNYDVLRIEGWDRYAPSTLPAYYFPKKRSLPAARVEFDHKVEQDFVRISLKTDGAFTSTPSIALVEGSSSRTLTVAPVEYNFYTATFRPLASHMGRRTLFAEYEVNGHLQTQQKEMTLYPVLPGQPSVISIDGGRLHIIADSSSVYKPLFLEAKRTGDMRYSLFPKHVVLDGGLRVRLRPDPHEHNQGLFFRRRNSWILLTNQREGEYFTGHLRRTPVDIALLTDSQPPAVSNLRLPTTYGKQPHRIVFNVRDNMSGVEYDELKLYINGVFAIPEIDGEHRRVEHRFKTPLARGSHSLLILLKDRIGNSGEVRRTFTVR
ncbi:MAG: M23 family metallopeptidase [Bacteroidetes bacterium]|nr:M23 family metallopeptidase [Bacteroidota bacterium]MCW5895977.1 M23 family metallopeptidase [Bacteroidota bacterium]